jgi:hypothetical protein
LSRDEDSDALIAISPRDLTKVALELEREAEEKAERRRHRPRAQTEPSTNPSDEERRLRHIEDTLLLLGGKDGTNGKVGNTRRDVDGVRAVLKYLAMGVAGSLLTAGAAVYQAGQRDGAKEREAEYLRAEVASLKAEVRELRAQLPAYRPSPWRPQGVDQ